MGSYPKENNVKVKDATDVNSVMRDMVFILLEDALDQDMEEKIISMYAKRITTNDIECHMRGRADRVSSSDRGRSICDWIFSLKKGCPYFKQLPA